MKKLFILPLLMCMLFVANAQQSFRVPKYTVFKLSNGLTVYLMEQKEVPLISISLSVPAATIYDGEKAGLSQLTASSLQSGSKNYSKDKIQETLDFAGASLGASSGLEFTRITSKFSTNTIDVIFPLIKDVVVNPVFEPKEFDKLKTRTKTSLQLAKQSPRGVMMQYWNSMMYDNHPYANPANGLIATVDAITTEDAKTFHAKYYRPNGAVLAVVGDFNTAEMKTRITKLFADWKKNSTTLNNPAASSIPDMKGSKVLLVNKADAKETTFMIGSKGVAMNNADRVAIDVVNTVLGGRFTSWLNDALRVNSGLTYGANSRFDRNRYGGTFYVSSFTATKTSFEAIDMALGVLDKLQKGIDDTTLQSARNYVVGQFPPGYETSGQLARLLNDMFIYGYNDDYINNFEKNVKQVDAAKAREIISKYYSKDNLRFLFIGKSADIKEGAKKYGPVIEKEIKEDGFRIKQGF